MAVIASMKIKINYYLELFIHSYIYEGTYNKTDSKQYTVGTIVIPYAICTSSDLNSKI